MYQNRQEWLARQHLWTKINQKQNGCHSVTVLDFSLSSVKPSSQSTTGLTLTSQGSSLVLILSFANFSDMLLFSASLSVGEAGSDEILGLGGEPELPVDNGRGLRLASSFFHFILRFWNHIFMCLSVRFSIAASSIRLGLEMYLLKWNSFSSSRSWPRVYAVRVRLFSSSKENCAPATDKKHILVSKSKKVKQYVDTYFVTLSINI